MKNIVLSIVSHGHYRYISSNVELLKISKLRGVKVVIKDNLKEERLKDYALTNDLTYLTSENQMGFGENNNFIFDYAKREVIEDKNDWFLIVNPDVVIEFSEFKMLLGCLISNSGFFFAPNLFKDAKFKTTENSIRKFASYRDLLNPFKFQPINRPYHKDKLKDLDTVEWASGAFLCITFAAFESVAGFDKKYFMYYEDVDLCYRLNQKGIKLRFLKNIRAVHKGEYKNRSVFSKHFRWYLNSLFEFLKVQSQNGR